MYLYFIIIINIVLIQCIVYVMIVSSNHLLVYRLFSRVSLNFGTIYLGYDTIHFFKCHERTFV